MTAAPATTIRQVEHRLPQTTGAFPAFADGQWQDVAVPRPFADPGTLCRRDVLLGFGRGAAGLALLTVTASACGSAPPEIDPLQAQLDLATADSAMARAATAAAAPPLVPALTQIASERAEHAQALSVEIARAASRPAPTATPETSGTSATTTTTTGTAAPPPTVKDVIAALRSSADSAAQLASTQSGYRAGLLGSISASCTASYTVGLNAPGAAS